jgi:hypothetical protein
MKNPMLRGNIICRTLHSDADTLRLGYLLRRLLDARERISYDDLAAAVKKLTATSARQQAHLQRCVSELVSAG